MNILWLKTELLHPVNKGGRIRTYEMLRQLKKAHHVTYLALDDGTARPDEVDRAREYCHELVRIPQRVTRKFTPRFFAEIALNAASGLPYFIQKYRSAAMRAEIHRLTQDSGFDLLVCDFLVPAVNLPEDLPCPAVLFQHNVEAEIWRRHSAHARNPILRTYLRDQWRRTVAFERRACGRFHRVIAVSESDKLTLESTYGLADVGVVETGIDVDAFRPVGRSQIPKRIVFTGSMDWLPNVDGMQWFMKAVFPSVKARHPGATLAIVGRDPNRAVLDLARGREDVIVTGTVDQVQPWIEEAAVYVVPLRVGGGTRLKIYEAMALERAVVSTSVGMEGLPVQHGKELRIVDEPVAFADEISDLLDRPADARALGLRAAERVRRDFGWVTVSEEFSRMCEDVSRAFRNDTSGAAVNEQEPLTCA